MWQIPLVQGKTGGQAQTGAEQRAQCAHKPTVCPSLLGMNGSPSVDLCTAGDRVSIWLGADKKLNKKHLYF